MAVALRMHDLGGVHGERLAALLVFFGYDLEHVMQLCQRPSRVSISA